MPSRDADEEHLAVLCERCGATWRLPGNQIAGICPYCRAPFAVAHNSTRRLQPQGVIPMAVTSEQAAAAIRSWLHRRWLAPEALRRASPSALRGVYEPYFFFNGHTTSSYTGLRGVDYQVSVPERVYENGQWVERDRVETRTAWYPVWGTVPYSFGGLAVDVLIPGWARPGDPGCGTIAAVPFRDDYLWGAEAHSYGAGPVPAADVAHTAVARTISALVCRDIGGDHQTIDAIDTTYQQLNFRYLLVPRWRWTCDHNRRSYDVVVSGKTGIVTGTCPKSVWKIVAIVLAVVLALLAVQLISNSGSSSASVQDGGSVSVSLDGRHPRAVQQGLKPARFQDAHRVSDRKSPGFAVGVGYAPVVHPDGLEQDLA